MHQIVTTPQRLAGHKDHKELQYWSPNDCRAGKFPRQRANSSMHQRLRVFGVAGFHISLVGLRPWIAQQFTNTLGKGSEMRMSKCGGGATIHEIVETCQHKLCQTKTRRLACPKQLDQTPFNLETSGLMPSIHSKHLYFTRCPPVELSKLQWSTGVYCFIKPRNAPIISITLYHHAASSFELIWLPNRVHVLSKAWQDRRTRCCKYET